MVVIVDSFELFGFLDHWLCRTLIPALPAQLRVVIAGRDVPAGRWRSYGPLLCAVPLANLRPTDAVALPRDVWGYEWTGGSNVIEVVISSLRRKLGDNCRIATIRGVGYRYGRASSTITEVRAAAAGGPPGLRVSAGARRSRGR